MGIECALRTARLSLRRWRQYVGLQNEVVLRAVGPNHDLGYPVTVECVDGTLLSTYHQRQASEEKPCLMTTRWQIKKNSVYSG